MTTKARFLRETTGVWMALSILAPLPGFAQQSREVSEEDVFTMSPFEVTANEGENYLTTTTLAGNRLNTDIRDLGTSISVYNKQFMDDIGATDNQTLLKYTLGTEIGGILGNYSGSGGGANPDKDAAYLNPQSTNRVRGLVSADNTRDLYLTSIPWEGYNVEAVDIQRGPNAILFGQGSAGGVINNRTKQALLQRDLGELSVRIDQYGSLRGTLDFNKVILDDELAVRVAAVYNATKFQQKPAFEDYNRQFVALRYQPKWFKKGDARTVFKVNYERGDSESNRPRNMPPGDRITPWFTELDKQLYNVAWMNDGNWEIPGRGDASRQNTDNIANPNFQPWIGGAGTNFGNNYYGGAILFYESGNRDPLNAMVINPNQYLGLNSLGERDGNIGGLSPSQPRGVAGYRDWASSTGQPFSTLIKNKFITDPKVFDFYNKLLDGDIKREWYDFYTYDLQFSQTFFKDKIGIDVGYHEEVYKNGNYSPLGGDNGALFVDVNEVWADGTNTEAGGWYQDGTRNTNAGRPFIQLGNGEGRSNHERESLRITAFATHDFSNQGNSWLWRLLGQQTVTGMYSQDDSLRYGQNWVKSTFVGDYYNQPFFQDVKDNNGRFWADFVPWRMMYVGDSMVGKSLGENLGIRSARGNPQVGESLTLRYFDPTWVSSVNPGDPWYNQVTAGLADGPALSTQAENPANYRGWVNQPVRLMTDSTALNREFLTTSRSWDDRYNDASALVWQGKFWNNAIIATAGVRRDKVGQTLTRWNRDASTDDPTQIPNTVSETGPIEKDSRSWGVVMHFDRLPLLDRLLDKSPISVSASYNKSDNFQTGQVFVDYFGQDLPLPKGETEDIGIVLATKDGRYSLRVNKFESQVANNVSSWLQFWNYGNNVGVFVQTYHQLKYNYEQRGNPNSPSYGDGIISNLPEPTDGAPNAKWNVDFRAQPGETQDQASAREIAVINAWDQWLTELAPLPQTMASAWSFAWDGSDFTEQGIEFRLTEDLVAKGYEFEFHAQVTNGWRLSLNGSRIESIRDNIGQTPVPGGSMSQIDYLLDFDRRIRETPMGELPMWWSQGHDYTARDNWSGHANGDLLARLAEQGTVVPENRLWRINLVSNYAFNDGNLAGLSVGGALRYQSAATLAYTPIQYANYIGYDLDAPYRDDAQIDVDVWVGYRTKIWNDKIEWQCQLNVSNVGVGNELVPVTVQPDGTPAAYRIRPAQQVFLTNTFRF